MRVAACCVPGTDVGLRCLTGPVLAGNQKGTRYVQEFYRNRRNPKYCLVEHLIMLLYVSRHAKDKDGCLLGALFSRPVWVHIPTPYLVMFWSWELSWGLAGDIRDP